MSANRGLRALAVAVFIAAVAYIAMRQLQPPDALPVSAPANEFSAMRALDHLRHFARQPHPFGSPAQDAVRDYITGQIRSVGVEPTVEALPITRDSRGGYPLAAGIVKDITARISGTANTRALVLMGHYDSVPGGPGAADDGEGVAVLLETLRALRTGPAPRNDLIFLFTDGEEAGLLGAKAFVDAHGAEVGLALNFESRGSSGPGMMFETSKDNGWLVRQLAKAAPYPIANSLSYAVYQLLPNDTDLTTFKPAGIPCMDFAFIGDITNYHTRVDDPDHIDPRSLQHQGSYALSLARHFGNLDLRRVTAPDVTYFNFPLWGVVVYPVSWAIWLALIAVVLLPRAGSFKATLLGAGGFLATIAASALAVLLLWRAVGAWHPAFRQMLQGDPYHAWVYRAACTALAVACFVCLYLRLRRRLSVTELWAGAMWVWLAITLLAAAYLPGGSYILTWPLIFSAAGFTLLVARRKDMESWQALAILLVCAIPAIVMLAPVIDQVYVALTMMLAPAPAVLTVLLLGLLIPLVEIMVAPHRWWLPAAALTLCAGFLIAGAAMAGFDAAHPRPSSLFYGLDADTGKASWFSGDLSRDRWIEPVLGANPNKLRTTAFMPFLKWPMMENAAAAMPLAAPVAELLDDHTAGAVRTLRLRISSPRGADDICVYGDPRAHVVSAEVNGKSVGPDMRIPDNKPGLSVMDAIRFNQWSFEYLGPPREGFELRLAVKGVTGPLRIVLVDQSYGLAGSGAPARPADTMPFPWVTDSVFVRKSYRF